LFGKFFGGRNEKLILTGGCPAAKTGKLMKPNEKKSIKNVQKMISKKDINITKTGDNAIMDQEAEPIPNIGGRIFISVYHETDGVPSYVDEYYPDGKAKDHAD